MIKKSKSFQEVINNLNDGLKEIGRKILNSKEKISYLKLLNLRKIQESKIEFIKKGYNFHKRETDEQKHLNTSSSSK